MSSVTSTVPVSVPANVMTMRTSWPCIDQVTSVVWASYSTTRSEPANVTVEEPVTAAVAPRSDMPGALVVAAAVAIYPDGAAAAAQFATGTKNAKACDGQRALSTGGDAAWKFTVPEINADTVRWSKQQIGIPFDWTCYAEARLRNNAIVQAMACQGDDGGQVTVTTMTDRMSASVWELSGH